MSSWGFAFLMRHLGHRVKRINSTWWYSTSRGIYTSFPFHRAISPSPGELRQVLGSDGLIARYTCDLSLGRQSYRLVCRGPYGLEALHSKARNQVRRGLEACVVRKMPFGDLVQSGPELDRETRQRQGRSAGDSAAAYISKYCRYGERSDGAEAWGAFVDGRLAAYLIAHRMDRCANVLVVRSSNTYLSQYPNNALLFRYISEALSNSAIDQVSIGLESIQEEMGSLDHFKERMGFQKEPIGQRLEVNPWFKGLLRKSLFRRGILKSSECWRSEFASKLAGFVRWYQEQLDCDE